MILYFTLPYPPTVNTYWRRTKYGMRRSDRANEYINAVAWATEEVRKQVPPGGLAMRLSVELKVHTPDKRRRDIDNISKAVLDALQKAAIYQDDNQIDKLTIIRMPDIGGYIDVCIQQFNYQDKPTPLGGSL